MALLAPAPAGAAITIPGNQWVKRPAPTVATLPNFPGEYDPRGWNHILYDPVGKRMVLYDGYVDASRPTSIYANALWTYDPVTNRLALESVSNWKRQSGVTVPLPQNVSTPPVRPDSYSASRVPGRTALSLWGAPTSVPTNYLGTLDLRFGTRKWREPRRRAPFTVFEQR